MRTTLGSLFDGSGGFPLAGQLNGITPVWASEVEPYPIAVTRSRFQGLKHLGDVSRVRGGSIAPVDIITFGSPCQDLSIAGNQKGLEEGKRSSLFFQAVRIIREMREATHGVYPAFAVWENVPGAYSSHKGNDFRLVLESLARVSDPAVSIPLPEKGRWQRSGEIVGDGWSVAWRTLDAQFWGVPQRRKRIYLVADFGGERAGQILFEREGVRGDPAPGAEAWEGAAADAPGSAGGSSGADRLIAFHAQQDPISSEAYTPCLGGQGQATVDVVYPLVARTLEARHDSSPCIDRGQNLICIHDKATRHQGGGDTRNDDGGGNGLGVAEDGVQYTLTAGDRHAVCFMAGQGAKAGSIAAAEELSPTLKGCPSGLNTAPSVVYPYTAGTLRASADAMRIPQAGSEDLLVCHQTACGTLDATSMRHTGGMKNEADLIVCHSIDCRNHCLYEELSGTLQAKPGGGQSLNFTNPVVYSCGNGQLNTACAPLSQQAKALDCMHDQQIVLHETPPDFCTYQETAGALCANSHPGSYTGQDAYNDMLVAGTSPNPARRFVVRRLLPVECARLQGFPDAHGIPVPYDGDDAFWAQVRVTQRQVAGRSPLPEAALKPNNLRRWYNRLHNDSAEYRMWGNGIALPCAAFVL
ncbi:MAG: DNA cytosine methyltransferase, partial [Candidatus Limiplasma sp.]|nr:DNA cytosine methyltransferase [Candidatus Limiplasma sp.]